MSESADCLREVKSWMTFLGWENGGNPGSVKKSGDGKVVATHGDATWIMDCDVALDHMTKEREAARAREALCILAGRDDQQTGRTGETK